MQEGLWDQLYIIGIHNLMKIKNTDTMKGAYLGPDFKNKEIEMILKNNGAIYEYQDDEEIIENLQIAKSILFNRVVQRRSEFDQEH